MAVDAVLFDLDETLVSYDRPSSAVLAAAFESVGVDPFFEVADFQARYETFLPESESIDHLRELIFADIAAEADRSPALGRRIAAEYAEERDHGRVSLLPGAEALLEELADRPLGLVTNGDPEMQRPKLDATGLGRRFDTIVYAGHDTASKPDPEPFQRALSDLDVRASRGAFVGNDPIADVDGAHEVGMRPVWIRNGAEGAPSAEPAETIDCLDELQDTWIVR
ncbi:MAG: HAD family hydrolase [Halanaeroarchaeum sp.]